MVKEETTSCPYCGGKLEHHDQVHRIVRTTGRQSKWIDIQRKRCTECEKTHRVIPDFIIPYKQYEREVIAGVVEGYITPDTHGYEDYPCEMTMRRWRSQKLQTPL